jgi:hypothetical protein
LTRGKTVNNGVDDDLAECSSAENSINIPAHTEYSRPFIQRRTRPRSGKHQIEETVVEMEKQNLHLMQSLRKEEEDRGTTYLFLDEPQGSTNKLPGDRQCSSASKFKK